MSSITVSYTHLDVYKRQDINIGDINAIAIGSWVTFKGLSNNNISLRSIDEFNTEEIALMGNLSSSSGISWFLSSASSNNNFRKFFLRISSRAKSTSIPTFEYLLSLLFVCRQVHLDMFSSTSRRSCAYPLPIPKGSNSVYPL